MQWGWRKRYPAPTRFIRHRVPAAEYLDQPDLPADVRRKSHGDLEKVDRLPWQFGPLWRACRRLLTGRRARELRQSGEGSRRPWRLLELGAGTGHTADRVQAAARRERIDLAITLTDREPWSDRVVRLDWLFDSLPECDVAYANLVLHHFAPADVVPALRRMKECARLGGIIYDLNRSSFTFHVFRWFFPLFASSPVTVADALISVQQAFTREELRQAALDAGIENPRVTTHVFFRNRLVWETPA